MFDLYHLCKPRFIVGDQANFSFDISRTATVHQLQDRIEQQTQIEPRHQLLSIYGTFKPLQSRMALIDYNIHDGARIQLNKALNASNNIDNNQEFDLVVRMIDGNTVTISIQTNDEVMMLKLHIYQTIGVSVKDQHLFLCQTNEQLKDDRILSSYGIRPSPDDQDEDEEDDRPQVELRFAMYVCYICIT